ncbi:hypothetical protein N7530_003151 [Penicillium desertorum]|uniref:Uncharacterized protein n=1 Tax=Penicillium desertorum TaxID=1303715 RepID=A0A9W9WVX5_9EURO|nr:hypothetical protein N7530_003151 [Penicillium desertorum]
MAILLRLFIGNSLGGIRNTGNTKKRILDFSTCRTGMPSFRMLCLRYDDELAAERALWEQFDQPGMMR